MFTEEGVFFVYNLPKLIMIRDSLNQDERKSKYHIFLSFLISYNLAQKK